MAAANAPLPEPGVTPGPDWASMINTAIAEKLKAVGGFIAAYEEAVNSPAVNGSTYTLDLSVSNVFRIAPAAAFTIAVTGQTSGHFQSFTLIVANSTYAMTLPAGTKYPNGAAPVLNGLTFLSGVSDENNQLIVGSSWGGVA